MATKKKFLIFWYTLPMHILLGYQTMPTEIEDP